MYPTTPKKTTFPTVWLFVLLLIFGSGPLAYGQIREYRAIPKYNKSFKSINPRSTTKPQVDLRPKINQMGLIIRDQGNRGTCSVFAMTFLLEYMYGAQMGNPMNLSEEYLNYMTNQAANNTGDGDFFHNIEKGYNQYGMIPDIKLEYKTTMVSSVSQSLINEGKRWTRFKLDYIKKWDVSNGASTSQMNQVIAYLDKGIPVAFGGFWPVGSVPNETISGVDLMPVLPVSEKQTTNASGKMFDGHSVALVGYCKNSAFPGGGYFIFRNSWDTTYGDKGYGYMPFEYVKRFANDLVAFKSASLKTYKLSSHSTISGSNYINVFATGTGGKPKAATWKSSVWNGQWAGWWNVLYLNSPGSAKVSAISRTSNQIDIFSTDKNGQIYTAAWNKGVDNGQWRGWWKVGTGKTKAGGEIVPVSRASNKLDIFVSGTNGGIYTAAWASNQANGKWRGWWRIGNLVSKPGASVDAVSRDANKLDVFAVANDGYVYTAAWDRNVADQKWRGWWKILNLKAPAGAPVTAVSRASKNLDIFVVGNDGYVYTAAWQQGVNGSKWMGWWKVGNQKFTPGTQIAAVSRDANKLDIFAIAPDGAIYTAAWAHNKANGKWQGWWRIKSGVAKPDGGISAVARDAGKLDVFIIGKDNAVWTAAWDRNVANQQWRGWWRVNP